MRILAFDSATTRCSAALWEDGRILAHEAVESGRAATEALVPMLDHVLARAGLGLGAVDRLAVTIGPGHFTGLRAGLAVARGLVLAAKRPIVAVTTLETVAAATDAAARQGRQLLVAIDSKRIEPYLQMFDAALAPLGAPLSLPPADFAAGLVKAGPVLVAGDAGPALVAALRRAGHDAVLADSPAAPDAALVATLAAERPPLAGNVQPLYLHPPAVKLRAAAGPAS